MYRNAETPTDANVMIAQLRAALIDAHRVAQVLLHGHLEGEARDRAERDITNRGLAHWEARTAIAMEQSSRFLNGPERPAVILPR